MSSGNPRSTVANKGGFQDWEQEKDSEIITHKLNPWVLKVNIKMLAIPRISFKEIENWQLDQREERSLQLNRWPSVWRNRRTAISMESCMIHLNLQRFSIPQTATIEVQMARNSQTYKYLRLHRLQRNKRTDTVWIMNNRRISVRPMASHNSKFSKE